MMYGSWYTECNTEFFVILDHFFPLTTWKIKILKYEKNAWRYYHFTQVYHKWQSYDVWFLRYEAWQTEFFVVLDSFLLFYPSNNMKNQNFEKMKKTYGDIIILHMCTINGIHMMNGFKDVKCDGQIFLLFWTVFCLFTPLTIWKIKIFKK